MTLLPFRSGPSATPKYGRHQDGDANALAKKFMGSSLAGSPTLDRVGHEYLNAHLSLDFGFRHVEFFLHGGATVLRGQVHNPDASIAGAGATRTTTVVVASDPVARAVGPSAAYSCTSGEETTLTTTLRVLSTLAALPAPASACAPSRCRPIGCPDHRERSRPAAAPANPGDTDVSATGRFTLSASDSAWDKRMNADILVHHMTLSATVAYSTWTSSTGHASPSPTTPTWRTPPRSGTTNAPKAHRRVRLSRLTCQHRSTLRFRGSLSRRSSRSR